MQWQNIRITSIENHEASVGWKVPAVKARK
jgi:hypothetical protein